jgi:lipopolysaccharide transport system ATP-binding protein
MGDIAIRTDGLSKKYHIGTRQESYRTLRDTLTDAFASPFRRARRLLQGHATGASELNETIWALKDVSFEVKKGEVIGIIGRNGAGKSTLLKILSRITEPTEGYADIYGRVGSLLEVGTGFHTELTGRENIYLNGAILGMRKAEIDKKFDEIVAFAEVEKFIDTPVKHYSTGMYLRLAFAVAAHLEPEILLVDEVLAVGDAQFQKKCLGKMGEVAREGRTVLLVSHNMIAISQLCRKCLWLDGGRLSKIGSASEVVRAYSFITRNQISGSYFLRNQVQGDGRVQLLSYRVTNQRGETQPLPVTNEDVFIHIRLRVLEPINQPACGIDISNERGVLMTSINTVEQGTILETFPAGEMNLTIRLVKVSFLPGSYNASFWVMNPQGHIYAMAESAIAFEIGQAPLYGTRQVDHRWGCVYTRVDFMLE